jgi:hypothetical protein
VGRVAVSVQNLDRGADLDAARHRRDWIAVASFYGGGRPATPLVSLDARSLVQPRRTCTIDALAVGEHEVVPSREARDGGLRVETGMGTGAIVVLDPTGQLLRSLC